MNIGIIIHSNSGHTLKVAHSLKEALSSKHQVTIEQVRALHEDPHKTQLVELKDAPKCEPYDILIFGSPVHGFRVSNTMVSYLKQLNSTHKKTFIYVTHFFPFKGMGGKQSIKQFVKLVSDKGFMVVKAAVVPWTFGKRSAIKNLIKMVNI